MVPVEEAKGWVYAGRRERQREKAGEGKTVNAFARMLVAVSGWRRWGLNWYLFFHPSIGIYVSRGSFLCWWFFVLRSVRRRGTVRIISYHLNISFFVPMLQVIGNVY